ncbi:MAG: hypothetical protein IPK03_15580 [Bacteroidetes bacterium]|nr:hypothetical protein [Bacteroidota bacterium]MBP7477553.1 hypothetical protein [Chitinophagales bacterium]
MKPIKKSIKNQFILKFYGFKLTGLVAYSKYLIQQLKLAKDKENWESYKKYIEKEIQRNDKKIQKVKEKLAE